MKFARDNLLPQDVYCYMAQLLNVKIFNFSPLVKSFVFFKFNVLYSLQEYSKNIVDVVKMDMELELVDSQKVNECDCKKYRKTEL